jgi:outer membrane protein OmpA-like peptidoglycan-associated protein
MYHSRIFSLSLVALAAATLLTACNTTPPSNALLDDARQAYQMAQETPQTRDLAPVELGQAGQMLSLANEAFERRGSTAEIDHLAYLARQRVAIAQETSKQRAAEMAVDQADGARDKIRLMARTQQVAVAMQETQVAQQQVVAVMDRNQALEAQLQALNAKKTSRGMVVTFGDVFFDTDQSQIKSGGMRSIDTLANFLNQYPQRKALVEGFTDNVGVDEHNLSLSGRRANAVRTALVDKGVDSSRVSTRGYGEAFPVAGNDSAGGRQLNRRVEIILSDDGGVIAPR